MIYEENIPCVQLETNSNRLSSMREVDVLNYSLIGLYVPALTPRLHRIEAAL